MTTRILPVLSAAALAVLFAACSTTPDDQKPAAVTERGAAAPAPEVSARKPAPTVDLTARGRDASAALKDPNSPLSKRQIFFEYDKFEIKDEYKGTVEAHAKYLRENPGAKMLIQGNADERGSREYNVGLGQRRSDTVKRALILLGAKDSQIESVSLGEEKPACSEHAEGCWAKNRRDDMLYNGEY
ncbi:MAG: peptidoglycan-associated lipoprotein [Betaproteobacteria bacterium]|jgi:peptidoglycan-associated lipoprotein|nr:peptidoglycan-associated lipoprotein [Betaproteobacteria bacterium]